MLKRLKEQITEHVKDVYDVNCSWGGENHTPPYDKVRLYFHFPYGQKTVTLHLHVRINQALHPYEVSRSFMLDDVINHLRHHDNVYDLILDRQPYCAASNPCDPGFQKWLNDPSSGLDSNDSNDSNDIKIRYVPNVFKFEPKIVTKKVFYEPDYAEKSVYKTEVPSKIKMVNSKTNDVLKEIEIELETPPKFVNCDDKKVAIGENKTNIQVFEVKTHAPAGNAGAAGNAGVAGTTGGYVKRSLLRRPKRRHKGSKKNLRKKKLLSRIKLRHRNKSRRKNKSRKK